MRLYRETQAVYHTLNQTKYLKRLKLSYSGSIPHLSGILDSLATKTLNPKPYTLCPEQEIFQVHDVSLGSLDGSVLRKRIKEGSGRDKLDDTGKARDFLRSHKRNRKPTARYVISAFKCG